jgi:hypothetical protein
LDWKERNAVWICPVPSDVLEEVREKIAVLLGLEDGEDNGEAY